MKKLTLLVVLSILSFGFWQNAECSGTSIKIKNTGTDTLKIRISYTQNGVAQSTAFINFDKGVKGAIPIPVSNNNITALEYYFKNQNDLTTIQAAELQANSYFEIRNENNQPDDYTLYQSQPTDW